MDGPAQNDYQSPLLFHLNVGFGSDVTIADLATAVSNAEGYQGKITFDSSKPDGAPRKWMDSNRLNHLGWKPQIHLQEGLALAYKAFLDQQLDS